MKELCRNSRKSSMLLVLVVLMGAASQARSEEKPASPSRTPKIREVVEIPEDYYGRTLTYNVWITTSQNWMRRGSGGDFFLFVRDAEGSQLPNFGLSPDSTVNLLRFVLPKEEGRKLINQLNAGKMYEATIRFTIDRERELVGPGWRYLARISTVEVK